LNNVFAARINIRFAGSYPQKDDVDYDSIVANANHVDDGTMMAWYNGYASEYNSDDAFDILVGDIVTNILHSARTIRSLSADMTFSLSEDDGRSSRSRTLSSSSSVSTAGYYDQQTTQITHSVSKTDRWYNKPSGVQQGYETVKMTIHPGRETCEEEFTEGTDHL
jgi:hypothetical protein